MANHLADTLLLNPIFLLSWQCQTLSGVVAKGMTDEHMRSHSKPHGRTRGHHNSQNHFARTRMPDFVGNLSMSIQMSFHQIVYVGH
jgi:hypothetical protein